MGVGIEVYNGDGSLQFDIGTRVFRVLVPSFATGSGAGSIGVDNSTGAVVVNTNMALTSDSGTNTITISGGTISWNAGEGQEGSILVF